jgi:hypothetical protein
MSGGSNVYEIFIAVLLWNVRIDADFVGMVINTEHCW